MLNVVVINKYSIPGFNVAEIFACKLPAPSSSYKAAVVDVGSIKYKYISVVDSALEGFSV